MYFIEYYNKDKKELCGSDSILWIDGRKSLDNKIQVAINNKYKPARAVYFRILKGVTIIREVRPVTDYKEL